MINLVFVLMSVVSAAPPPSVVCLPVAAYGATPDDGIDDRVALQRALNAGCLDLRGAPGRYDVEVPAMPRALQVLRAPPGAQLLGDGDGVSVIAFSGSAAGDDAHLVKIDSNVHIRGVHFDGDGMRRTTEHVPLIFGVGPLHGVRIERNTFFYPPRVGEKRGDCIQIIGYAPDMLNVDTTIERNTFQACGRAAYAWHSGTVGLRFRYNTIVCSQDGACDGEGRGNEPYALISDSEIAYNTFGLCDQLLEGAIELQIIRGERLNVHHNTFNGRGWDIKHVRDSRFHHNFVRQTIADGQEAVITVRGESTGLVFEDEHYERVATGGVVLSIERRDSGPRGIQIRDSVIKQHATWHPVRLAGVSDIVFVDTSVIYAGAPGQMSGVTIEGIGAIATGNKIIGGAIVGQLGEAVMLSGAYAGAGTLELQRLQVGGPQRGIRCDDAGGIQGPITLVDTDVSVYGCNYTTQEP